MNRSAFPAARVRGDEWMDDPDIDPEVHRRALRGLRRLNAVSGIGPRMARRVLDLTAGIVDRPVRVLDIASGSGDLPIRYARAFRRRGRAASITCSDISETALADQQSLAERSGVEVRSIRYDVLNDPPPGRFDLITNSLFLHHLDDGDIPKVLRTMASIADHGLVSDLVRSRINLGMVSVAAKAVTRSPVVYHDGRVSVRQSLTPDELRGLAKTAELPAARVRKIVPCRMVLTWGGCD